MNRHRDVLLLIAFFAAIRIWVAPTFGLGVDEAHYILYAVHLDLSYVDHPPLVGWVHAPFYFLFGTSELFVRLPAILLFALTSFLAYLFTMEISGSKKISFLAVLALNSSFLFNAMGLMLLPESILLVLVFPLISVIRQMEEKGDPKYFVILGLILGLCGLAKYTSVVLVPSILVYFVFRKRFDLIFSAYTLVSVAIALLMISPVLYWNMQNDYISLRYQWSHVMGPSTLKILSLLSSLGAQAGAFSPFLFGIALYGFYRGFRSEDVTGLAVHSHWRNGSGLFTLRFAVRPVSAALGKSLLSSFHSDRGLLSEYRRLGCQKENMLHFSVGVSLVITLFLYAELAAKWFTFPDYNSPFRDIYGFDSIAKEADALLKEDKNARKALAVTDWTMGSRMIYYSLPYKNEVFVVDDRTDQFDYWEKGVPLGYDLLFVEANPHSEDKHFSERFRCDEMNLAKHAGDHTERSQGEQDRVCLVQELPRGKACKQLTRE